ncbi:MAG: hypothetical protein SCALA701_24700 [Candidatus Scalindua sp.]|nr:MAG: hypothetical protein SCALA701_24700 [Candidatus Scalindua sp.]
MFLLGSSLLLPDDAKASKQSSNSIKTSQRSLPINATILSTIKNNTQTLYIINNYAFETVSSHIYYDTFVFFIK